MSFSQFFENEPDTVTTVMCSPERVSQINSPRGPGEFPVDPWSEGESDTYWHQYFYIDSVVIGRAALVETWNYNPEAEYGEEDDGEHIFHLDVTESDNEVQIYVGGETFTFADMVSDMAWTTADSSFVLVPKDQCSTIFGLLMRDAIHDLQGEYLLFFPQRINNQPPYVTSSVAARIFNTTYPLTGNTVGPNSQGPTRPLFINGVNQEPYSAERFDELNDFYADDHNFPGYASDTEYDGERSDEEYDDDEAYAFGWIFRDAYLQAPGPSSRVPKTRVILNSHVALGITSASG